MAEFLNGVSLVAAVKRVLEGENVRCAVAFWGEGAAEFLSSDDESRKGVRIVCDLSMGCTSPRALRKLGAPTNDRLRFHDHLHAKVYLSDIGAVIGSANMSANALGFGGKVRHREAAMFLDTDEDGFQEAVDWFDALYDGSKKVNRKALKRTEERHRPGPAMVDSPSVRKSSILDLVVADPDAFGNIGFVFSDDEAKPRAVTRARQAMKRSYPLRAADIKEWDEERMFIEWDRDDVERWPTNCIEYFRPKDELTVLFQTLQMKQSGEEEGNVFTSDGRDVIGSIVPFPLPATAKVEVTDDALVARLLDVNRSKVYQSAYELREAILDLDE